MRATCHTRLDSLLHYSFILTHLHVCHAPQTATPTGAAAPTRNERATVAAPLHAMDLAGATQLRLHLPHLHHRRCPNHHLLLQALLCFPWRSSAENSNLGACSSPVMGGQSASSQNCERRDGAAFPQRSIPCINRNPHVFDRYTATSHRSGRRGSAHCRSERCVQRCSSTGCGGHGRADGRTGRLLRRGWSMHRRDGDGRE